jgi:hypothetical protein
MRIWIMLSRQLSSTPGWMLLNASEVRRAGKRAFTVLSAGKQISVATVRGATAIRLYR